MGRPGFIIEKQTERIDSGGGLRVLFEYHKFIYLRYIYISPIHLLWNLESLIPYTERRPGVETKSVCFRFITTEYRIRLDPTMTAMKAIILSWTLICS